MRLVLGLYSLIEISIFIEIGLTEISNLSRLVLPRIAISMRLVLLIYIVTEQVSVTYKCFESHIITVCMISFVENVLMGLSTLNIQITAS